MLAALGGVLAALGGVLGRLCAILAISRAHTGPPHPPPPHHFLCENLTSDAVQINAVVIHVNNALAHCNCVSYVALVFFF